MDSVQRVLKCKATPTFTHSPTGWVPRYLSSAPQCCARNNLWHEIICSQGVKGLTGSEAPRDHAAPWSFRRLGV